MSSRFRDLFSFFSSISIYRVTFRPWISFNFYRCRSKLSTLAPIAPCGMIEFFTLALPSLWATTGEPLGPLRPVDRYHCDHLVVGNHPRPNFASFTARDDIFFASFQCSHRLSRRFRCRRGRLPRQLALTQIYHLRLALTFAMTWTFLVSFSSPFDHFLASHRLDTTNHHLRWLPLADAELLRPPTSPAMAADATGYVALLDNDFPTFWPFFGQLVVRHRGHHYQHLPPIVLCWSWPAVAPAARTIVGAFRQWASAANLVPVCLVHFHLTAPVFNC